MTYSINFTAGARRDLGRLSETVAAAVLEFCMGPLAENPYRVGKALVRDLAGLHSARRGEYRVVYQVVDEVVTVTVVRVRHRGTAYRGT